MNAIDLTETQRNTLSFGMRIAAERYDEHAKTMRTAPVLGCSEDLAKQFDRQAAEAQALADLIDDAYSITVTPFNEAIHGEADETIARR